MFFKVLYTKMIDDDVFAIRKLLSVNYLDIRQPCEKIWKLLFSCLNRLYWGRLTSRPDQFSNKLRQTIIRFAVLHRGLLDVASGMMCLFHIKHRVKSVDVCID